MPILLSDSRVGAVPVVESGEPLVRLDSSYGPARALVRAGLATRLAHAAGLLPDGLALRVVEGHRSAAAQSRILASYGAQLARLHPAATAGELHDLASRFVAPLDVAPHVAGAAVDLTLVRLDGRGLRTLDLGTAIDATPEDSDGRCYLDHPGLSPEVRARRDLLRVALGGAGLVNYPTEWWHWSYGDRYWALMTGAPAALYGSLDGEAAA